MKFVLSLIMTILLISDNLCWTVFFSCVTLSCTQQNAAETFIVPPDTIPFQKTIDSQVPPPPSPNRAYYLPSNFIIDTNGQVFFYQMRGKWNDDERTDWNTPPKFINLNPKDIVQIPVNDIEDFFKVNILNLDSSKRYVAIASEKDTIKSFGLSKIIALCKEKDYHIRWKFRKITQEEAVVLDYKKKQKAYYPNEIKWDSTKIKEPSLEK